MALDQSYVHILLLAIAVKNHEPVGEGNPKLYSSFDSSNCMHVFKLLWHASVLVVLNVLVYVVIIFIIIVGCIMFGSLS